MASAARLSPYLRQRRRITDSFGDVFENLPDRHWADGVADDGHGAFVAAGDVSMQDPALALVQPLQLDFSSARRAAQRATSAPAESHFSGGGEVRNGQAEPPFLSSEGCREHPETGKKDSTATSRHTMSSTSAPRAASVPRDVVLADGGLPRREELDLQPRVKDDLSALLLGASDPTAPGVEHVSWDVDLERILTSERRRLGLMLQPFAVGKAEDQAMRVASVKAGCAMDAWNAAATSVTVRLHPSGRDAPNRSVTVQRGDEIVAINGEPVGPWESERDRRAVILRIRSCGGLTCRRWMSSDKVAKIAPRRGCTALGGA